MSVEREQRKRAGGQKEERAGRRDERREPQGAQTEEGGVRSSGEGAGGGAGDQQEVPLGRKLTYFSWAGCLPPKLLRRQPGETRPGKPSRMPASASSSLGAEGCQFHPL